MTAVYQPSICTVNALSCASRTIGRPGEEHVRAALAEARETSDLAVAETAAMKLTAQLGRLSRY